MVKFIKAYLFVTLMLFTTTGMAAPNYQEEIKALLASASEPAGVVIEIVSDDEDLLDWALAEVKKISKQLRAKYPKLDIVVVSHGDEQFALTQNNLDSDKALKGKVQGLLDANVSISVCGTYADWNGVEHAAFAKEIDVAVTGPALINDYRNLGYTLIRLYKSDDE